MENKNSFSVGDIISGRKLGRVYITPHYSSGKFILASCNDCGKERWINLRKYYQGIGLICKSCAAKRRCGERSNSWHGGKTKLRDGYIACRGYDGFFKPMAVRNGYILEHRLVMGKHLGRCLQSREIVHHKNGIKDDNRIENLELQAGISQHIVRHNQGYRDGFNQGYKDGLNKKIKELEIKIKQLEVSHSLLP